MLTTASSARAPSLVHLGALDGLRFIAASCVLIAHGFFYLVLEQDERLISPYNAPLLGLATIGMTLFFTLSGFVIHYNYAASLERPGGNGVLPSPASRGCIRCFCWCSLSRPISSSAIPTAKPI